MSTVLSPLLEAQLSELRADHEGVVCTAVGDGSFVVKVAKVDVPVGWTANQIDVWFVVPVQYPSARPDCFWTEASLLLTGELIPQNTGGNVLPGSLSTPPLRWYSWHVTQWSALGDTLTTYLQVIRRRFADPK
ncbi:MAG: hypothetical protein JWN25_3010 [Verrucomicrobiales bacterium]|nr:hypothetical protein [Verrucomicrobiales bacterium]